MSRVLALILTCLLLLPSAISVEAASKSYTSIQPMQLSGQTFCTAFSINERDGLWATAKHCAEAVDMFAVTGRGRATLGGEYMEVVRVSEHWDIAVLYSHRRAKAFEISESALEVGDEVDVIGFPYGLSGSNGPSVTRGRVAAINVPIEEYHLSTILDVVVAGGNSGSPVLRAGKVVGILWGGFTESAHSLAVPGWAVADELRMTARR